MSWNKEDELAIDPNRIVYPEEPKQKEIPLIHLKHYFVDIRRREISIFCSSLVNNMNWKLRIKFWIKGNYHKALLKTYDELLQKKKRKRGLMALYQNDLDKYYCTGTRGEMIGFCSNLLSQMNRLQRFRFVYFLQYYQALYKTHRTIMKMREKNE